VLKERHSTAKKLRRYYLQCLKQLLEEDKSCAESDKPPLTTESKIERMAKALDAISPERSCKGKIQTQLPKAPIFQLEA
jgi:centrosomal protein CEP152